MLGVNCVTKALPVAGVSASMPPVGGACTKRNGALLVAMGMERRGRVSAAFNVAPPGASVWGAGASQGAIAAAAVCQAAEKVRAREARYRYPGYRLPGGMEREKGDEMEGVGVKVCRAAGAATPCPPYTPAAGAPTSCHTALVQRRSRPVGEVGVGGGDREKGRRRSVALRAMPRARGAALPLGAARL
jgi:hypothetical protein